MASNFKLQIFGCVLRLWKAGLFFIHFYKRTQSNYREANIESKSKWQLQTTNLRLCPPLIVYDFHLAKLFLRMFCIIDRIYPILKAIPMPIWFHGSTDTCKLLIGIIVFSTQMLKLWLLFKFMCYVPPLIPSQRNPSRVFSEIVLKKIYSDC